MYGNMNKIELFVYNLVKDNPVLKQKIVDVYQNLMGLIPQKSLKTDFISIERKGYFYGFHDKSPFSNDGSMLLAHHNLIGDRTVQAGDMAEVGFFSGSGWKEYTSIGKTSGWNWQLGSMLQWYGTSNELVVYNTLDGNKPIAIVQNINGKIHKEFPFPVVHISPDSHYACSYNFFRVEKAMPGYGMVINNPELGNDTNNYFRIFSSLDDSVSFEVSLEEIAKISHHPSMDGAFHYFHHALFNPTSKRVFFLHRWLDKNERRWTRMFSVGVDGSELYLFPMDEMVSHITWASPTEIFSYLRYPGIGDGYFLVEDLSGKFKQYFDKELNSDGHPTMDMGRGLVITDTYPDRFRNQYLKLALLDSEKIIDLCRAHLPSSFRRELQVDLHPRLHPDLPVACIDSGHSGTRALLTIDFSEALG